MRICKAYSHQYHSFTQRILSKEMKLCKANSQRGYSYTQKTLPKVMKTCKANSYQGHSHTQRRLSTEMKICKTNWYHSRFHAKKINTVKRNENPKSNSHHGCSSTQRTMKMGDERDDSRYFVHDCLKNSCNLGMAVSSLGYSFFISWMFQKVNVKQRVITLNINFEWTQNKHISK